MITNWLFLLLVMEGIGEEIDLRTSLERVLERPRYKVKNFRETCSHLLLLLSHEYIYLLF